LTLTKPILSKLKSKHKRDSFTDFLRSFLLKASVLRLLRLDKSTLLLLKLKLKKRVRTKKQDFRNLIQKRKGE
jgi:hypothetical protein